MGVWFSYVEKVDQKLEIHTPPKSRPQFEAAMFGLSQKTSGAPFGRTVLSLKFSEVNVHTTTVGGGQLKHLLKFISRSLQQMIQFDCCIFFPNGLGTKRTPTRITYYILYIYSEIHLFSMLFSVKQGSPPLVCCFGCLVLVWYAFLISFRFNFGTRTEGWFEYFDFALPETTRYKRSKAPHLPCFFWKNRGEVGRFRCKGEKYRSDLIFRNVHIGEEKEAPQRTCGSAFNMEKSPNYGVLCALCSSPIWIVHEWRICWHTQK